MELQNELPRKKRMKLQKRLRWMRHANFCLACAKQVAERQAEQRQAEQRQAEQRQAEQRQAEQRQAELRGLTI